MKTYHFLILVLLGMLLMPISTFACESGKNSCEKDIPKTKTEKKSCCESDNKSKNDDKGCNGHCGHSKCGCASTCPSSSVSFLSDVTFKNDIFRYSFIEKVKFSYTTPSILDGFYSIWLIPKIS